MTSTQTTSGQSLNKQNAGLTIQATAMKRAVGVYMQAMITRGLLDAYLYTWMRAHTHVHMVQYGRRTNHGLKYLFVEDTGSGSVPLP